MSVPRSTDAPTVRGWAAAALMVLASAAFARAGLIIEIDPAIDAGRISDLAIHQGNLVVRYHDGDEPTEIRLPRGALERVAIWAAGPGRGPMVVSIDSVFVRQGAQVYFPPYIETDLGKAFVQFDAFAADLAVGALPPHPEDNHPLLKRTGSRDLLPSRQYALLMDRDDQSPRAIWYRQLAGQYTVPPGYPQSGTILAVIGELTVRAVPAGKPLPVRLEVVSHRWIVPARWYRGSNVPSEWDRWAAALPFEPLRQDIELHWDEYRRAFTKLDELSGIVEAVAVLRAVNTQNSTLWSRFRDRLMQGMEELDPPPLEVVRADDELTFPENPPASKWIDLCSSWVFPEIETTAEANLALAFLFNGQVKNPALRQKWHSRIEVLAEDDLVLRARLVLADAMAADPKDETLRSARRFFEMTRGHPELFRLRCQGLHLLQNRSRVITEDLDKLTESFTWPSLAGWVAEATAQNGQLRMLLAEQRRALLADFQREVSDRLSRAYATRSDAVVWEDLSQDVYSDDLLTLATEQGRGHVDPLTVRYVAEILYHRGKAPQAGMELAYRHANFRFLAYLMDLVPDQPALRQRIHGYRAELANLMGLEAWEKPEEQP
jgi:hypothetical protein